MSLQSEKYLIEIVEIGFQNESIIDISINFLNAYQETFTFVKVTKPKFQSFNLDLLGNIRTKEAFDLMDEFF